MMTRKEMYNNRIQMDYFSDSYIKFEEDFYRYSALITPLSFLLDDILLTMAAAQTNYFILNKEKSKDGRDHRFVFRIETSEDNKQIRRYQYVKHEF